MLSDGLTKATDVKLDAEVVPLSLINNAYQRNLKAWMLTTPVFITAMTDFYNSKKDNL
jgi:hypothetical protein